MKSPLPNPVLGDRFVRALTLAVAWHGTQARRGGAIPYVSHLMSVCATVLEAGGSEDEAIAALLHDAIEDAPSAEQAAAREATICEAFGDAVVGIVLACTDGRPGVHGKKPSWEERKQSYVAGLAAKSSSALLVIAGDKLHNLTSLVQDLRRDGVATLGRFNAGADRQRWYFGEIGKTLTERGSPLAAQFGGVLAEFEALTQ